MSEGRNHQHRVALEAALRAMPGAFTVHQMHTQAQLARPSLGLTTTYRAVHRWQRTQRVHPAGKRHGQTQWIGDQHDSPLHIVCSECGAITDLDPRLLNPLRNQARSIGFDLAEDRLRHLPGICPACAQPATTDS